MSLLQSLKDFTLDVPGLPVVALRVQTTQSDREIPFHTHRKGQLILTLHGGVTCLAPDAYWMVPFNSAVWIPGGYLHSNRVTPNAQVLFLYIEPEWPGLPDTCCTLHISPMLREMMKHFAGLPFSSLSEDHNQRFARVMLDELVTMPVNSLHLPISPHPKMQLLADKLMNAPGDRCTLSIWASRMAMSKRSFERFVLKETGMTFGRWRQQLQLLVAIRLLVTGLSVQHVACELGYDSPTAFITMFKKILGQTPGRYLQNNRE